MIESLAKERALRMDSGNRGSAPAEVPTESLRDILMGGGSAQVAAHHAVVPYEALLAAVGDAVELRYAPGCSNDKVLPLPPRAMLRAAGGAPAGAR